MDCQPKLGPQAARRRHCARRAVLDDPHGRGQQHHAPPLPGALPADPDRARHRAAGQPDDLQEVLRRAHPGLRETSQTLRILGDQNQIIKDFITDSDTVITELERNKQDVVRWIEEAGDAAEITATRQDELRAGLRRFPTFLDELRPTMERLGHLADEQTPLLTDLQRAAPDLNTFFDGSAPFSEPAGRRSTRSARRRSGQPRLQGRP